MVKTGGGISGYLINETQTQSSRAQFVQSESEADPRPNGHVR